MNGVSNQELIEAEKVIPSIPLTSTLYLRGEGGPGRRSPSHAAFPLINRHKLAEACGVTDSCIGKVFNRDTVPGLKLAGRMAKVLGVSMEELLKELGHNKVKGNTKAKAKAKAKSHKRV